MASSRAATVEEYLAELPADRRAVISAVRDVVNANLPDGYVEGMQYGMIGWYVPLERYPDTYNGQPIGPAGLAAQKHYNALYLVSVYGDVALAAWFKAAFEKAGKKLDMGKSCVRFKTLDDLPLDVIGQTIAKVPVAELVARYEAVKGAKGSARKTRAASAKNQPVKKTAAKKTAAKRTSAKRTAAKRKSAKRSPAARKPSAKQPSAKKPSAKQPSAKPPSAKQPSAKTPSATQQRSRRRR